MKFGRSRSEIVHYATSEPSFVSVNHCPGGPFFRRTGDFNNDIIGAGGWSQNSSARESASLPGVIFGQFSSAVIQMDRNPGVLYVCPHAKPVIVSLKKGVRYRLLFSQTEITAPLVIADDIPLLDVRIHRLKRARDCIVKRRIRRCEDRAKA